MPTPTYVAIATVTVGSGGAANIEFTSIVNTYTDLLVKCSLRTDGGNGEIALTFNGSSSGYSERVLYGTGAAAGSAARTSQADNIYNIVNPSTATASTFGNGELYIPNYAGSNNKSYSFDTITENNGTTAYIYMTAGLWANTAAITSIKLDARSTNKFVQHSTATLFGIKNS